MDRIIDLYCAFLEALLALLLATMVVLVFGNVALRYLFDSGILVSEELSRWLFVWTTFIGAIVALRRYEHVGTDIVVSRLPPLAKRVCMILGQLLMLWVTWLLFSGSLEQAKINMNVLAPATQAPVAILYAACLVFAVSTGAILLLDLFRTIWRGESRATEVADSVGSGSAQQLRSEDK